jgi:hypothetical protein
MIKKVLVSVIAAGALSVPFAGLAGADPAPDNPGVPGSFGGTTPGSLVSNFVQTSPTPPGTVGHLLGAQHGFSVLGQQQGK